jgi:alpha-beta hydrolase superfamily lysophospholipase
LAKSAAAYSVASYTASDGYCCQYRYYPAAKAPVSSGNRAACLGHVVCLHGIQSHGGWYEYSCTRLSQSGYAVHFLDRRGSGLNNQDRGDTPSFQRLLDDVAEFLQKLRLETSHGQETVPIFLLAISWGGKLAAALQRWKPGLVSGLAFICPGFFPRIRPAFGERLRIGWSRLFHPERFFPVPLNDPQLFTATPRWQEFLRGDSFSLHRATARFLFESVRLDRYLRWVPGHCKVPVLLLLAAEDRIIDNDATRRFLVRFASPDKQIIEYAGAHHTLEFEPDPEPYVADLLNWLNRHIPQ